MNGKTRLLVCGSVVWVGVAITSPYLFGGELGVKTAALAAICSAFNILGAYLEHRRADDLPPVGGGK